MDDMGAVLRAHLKRSNEPRTVPEIADVLDLSPQTARDRLGELAERDPTVESKQIGAETVWFLRHGALHEQAFEAFVTRVREECGEAIDRFILYGSLARGEAHDHSDVNVKIVLAEHYTRGDVSTDIFTIATDIFSAFDIVIDERIVLFEQFADKRAEDLWDIHEEAVTFEEWQAQDRIERDREEFWAAINRWEEQVGDEEYPGTSRLRAHRERDRDREERLLDTEEVKAMEEAISKLRESDRERLEEVVGTLEDADMDLDAFAEAVEQYRAEFDPPEQAEAEDTLVTALDAALCVDEYCEKYGIDIFGEEADTNTESVYQRLGALATWDEPPLSLDDDPIAADHREVIRRRAEDAETDEE